MTEQWIKAPSAAPSDTEAEQAVLGAILLSGKIAEPLASEIHLDRRHFYRPDHGLIYEAMQAIAERGEQPDPRTVRYELEARGQLEAAGGPNALELLAGTVPALGNWRAYATRVVTMATWRQRLNLVYGKLTAIIEMDEAAYTDASLVDEGRVEAGHDGLLTPEDLARQWVDWYDASNDDTIPTPWPKINAGLFGGLRPGDMSVWAGYPGKGKSTAGDQVLDCADGFFARERGRKFLGCAYLNEMGAVDRTSRLLAGRAGASFKRIMQRELTPAEIKSTLAAAPSLPFAIQPCAGWSAEAIARHMRRYKWDMAFVDHATRIPARDTSDWDRISRTLSDAARQTGTHLLAAVQLNRERSTSAERPMPVLRDLRNTTAWEQDARAVLFVHRREEFDRDTNLVVEYDDGVIHLAKVNNGHPEAERVYLNYREMRFRVLVEGPEDRREDW
jgi:replicative DNA helicase